MLIADHWQKQFLYDLTWHLSALKGLAWCFLMQNLEPLQKGTQQKSYFNWISTTVVETRFKDSWFVIDLGLTKVLIVISLKLNIAIIFKLIKLLETLRVLIFLLLLKLLKIFNLTKIFSIKDVFSWLIKRLSTGIG